MAKHTAFRQMTEDRRRRAEDGKSSNPQNHFSQLKTNTALQMPALECCYRGESAKIEFKVI